MENRKKRKGRLGIYLLVIACQKIKNKTELREF
jgi:hypothetical protein